MTFLLCRKFLEPFNLHNYHFTLYQCCSVHNFFYVISGLPDPSIFCGPLCTQKIHLGSHASHVLVRTHFCVPDNSKLLLWLKAIMNCGIFNIMFCYCMVHILTGTFSVLSHVLFLTLSHQGSEVQAPCET